MAIVDFKDIQKISIYVYLLFVHATIRHRCVNICSLVIIMHWMAQKIESDRFLNQHRSSILVNSLQCGECSVFRDKNLTRSKMRIR